MSEAAEWVSAIGGAVGGIVGVASGLWTWANSAKVERVRHEAAKALEVAEKAQTQAQVGWLELQLRVFISSRRDKIHEADRDLASLRQGRDPAELSATEKVHFKDIFDRFFSAHEDLLNAMEQACRHLRDAKVEPESFRLMYDSEIRRITVEAVEGEPFYKLMYPREKSKFRAVWAVSDEWFNLEKAKK